MKPGRWEEVEKLYHAALAREPAERAAFLADAAGGDDSLRAEVESLLMHREQRGVFLEAPATKMLASEAMGSRKSEAEPVGDSLPVEDGTQKPRRRAPWWIYCIAVVFLVGNGVRYYALYTGPDPPGYRGQPVKDNNGVAVGVAIRAVQPDSAAERAGLMPGDIISIPNSDALFFAPSVPPYPSPYWEAGYAYRLEIRRKQESRTVFLKLERTRWNTLLQFYGRGYTICLMIAAVELILAAMIAFTRPYDPAVRWGALLLAVVSHGIIYPGWYPLGWYSTVLSLPRTIGWLMVLSGYSGCLGVSICITFAAVFPRRLFKRPWIWALVWLPGALAIPTAIFGEQLPIYSFPRWWPDWYDNLGRSLYALGWCAAIVVAIVNYLHLRDLTDRRRIRIVLMGLAVTLIACMPIVAILLFPTLDSVRRLLFSHWIIPFALSLLISAFPVSVAYAILRHRLFDIRVMIRLGLRYAAARGMLLSLVPIVGVVLACDLLIHGNQPLMQILGQRGLLYGALASGGFLLHIRRRDWLDALDRRFFREHYDAQRVLRAVVDEVRKARDFEKVAPHVVSQIEAALHPEFASLLAHQPGEAAYRVMAASGKSPPPIPVDSKLMTVVRVLGKPVEISLSQTGWPWSQLPQQENDLLRQAHLEWLFPISLVEGRTEALLAVGPKRSEEPYSREDQELLQGITSSLALLLEESPGGAGAAREGFEECPECGACYDSGSGSCRKEGARLTPLPFPRLFARRYCFERRLGVGGMGMVYEAHDTELERRVAVKLIRPDLMASAEAAARFKREAKAAASFTHPNVVTVHDFGVAEDQRAYLVMELLRGSTLRQELSRSGRLPARRAAQVLQGICAAVDAAHRQRLLHRDLKPENIFLADTEGVEIAKVLDFGVVKPITPANTTQSSGQTGSGILLGTLRYMSPEQLRGEKPAESWDLWALAVVAYEMLAGAHPFDGSTVLDVHNAILAGRVTPLNAHWPEAPPSWQRFFDQALALRVESRPNSALKLFSDFAGAMCGPPPRVFGEA